MKLALLVTPLELRKGDVLRSAHEDILLTVDHVTHCRPNPQDGTSMFVAYEKQIGDRVREDNEFVLVHRPEDSDKLLDRAAERAEEFVLKRSFSRQDADRTATALRKVLEAYELAKPMEK